VGGGSITWSNPRGNRAPHFLHGRKIGPHPVPRANGANGMLAWVFFFFVAFGSKVILATAMIYLILEEERGCPSCDAETALLRMGLPGRLLSLCSGGRVQKRWCPQCGWEGLTRSGTLNQPVSRQRGAIPRPTPER
jgi:hypothetical protein